MKRAVTKLPAEEVDSAPGWSYGQRPDSCSSWQI